MRILPGVIALAISLTGASICFADESVQQQFQGFNLNGYTDSGKKAWDINGDKADISDDQIKITNVNANSFDKHKANLAS